MREPGNKYMRESGNKYSRREFVAGSIAGFTAMTNPFSRKGLSRIDSLPMFRREKEIIYRTLGRTGISVPVVSMGVMNSDNPELIKSSYDEGIRLYDTAKAYLDGNSERMIGQVVNEFGLRKKVTVQTKILHPVGKGFDRVEGPLDEAQVTEMFIDHFNSSLSRLNMDHVDILYYHAADAIYQVNDPGVRKALDRIKHEGKARFIGISTHQLTDVLDSVIDAGIFDVIMVIINFTMDDDKEHLEAIEKAAAAGLGVVAMKTQGGNRLANGIPNHTAALKWVLNNESIATAIPGYTNFDQMRENISAACDLKYTDDEREFLEDNNVKIGMQFCRQCRRCESTCPKNADIPGLMRTHMYADGYANFYQARCTLDSISFERGLSKCVTCDECIAYCINSINISKKVEDLKLIYA